MLQFLNNKKTVLPLLCLLFVLFFYIALTSEATFDAGDGIRHYLISRYSWQHPALLLDSWGKPFFTLISSPFSQFGLLGANLFNILCAALSGYFCFCIAKKLRLNYPLLVIVFLFFTPCYFPVLNSGLTEPFFGLVLIASVYLMIEKRYGAAALLVSFLPFVRSEGNLLLPLFFVVLAYRKKWLLSPLLAFGTIVYSIIGGIYYRDLFWISNRNPYSSRGSSIYGRGGLLHFVNNHNFIWGTALGLLFIGGCIAVAFQWFKNRKPPTSLRVSSFFIEETVLIYGSFFVYFVAHTVFWWQGMVGSMGLLRVIAAVIPCSAFICLRGFNFLNKRLFLHFVFLEYILIPLLLFFVIASPFRHDYFPYRLNPEQALVKEAGSWFSKSAFNTKKIFYLYPYFAQVINRDPFDREKTEELWFLYPDIKSAGIGAIADSSLVIWDAHFGPAECRIPLDSLLSDVHFEPVRSFKPAQPVILPNGIPFEIYCFMKVPVARKITLLGEQPFNLDDSLSNLKNTTTVSVEKAFSGSASAKLSAQSEYSIAVSKQVKELAFYRQIRSIDFKVKIAAPADESKDALLVFSVDDERGKNVYWSGKPLVTKPIAGNAEWKTATATFLLPPDLLKNTYSFTCYVWNKNKKQFYIDDLALEYRGVQAH